MTIAFFLALIILPVLTQVITRNDFEDLFGYALYPDYADYSENCVCVPYWQCKEDYSDLIDDGIDIMDTR